MGAELARRYRAYNERADAIVCAFGCLFCTIFLYGTLAISRINLTVAYVSCQLYFFKYVLDSQLN